MKKKMHTTKTVLKQKERLAYYEKATQIKVGSQCIVKLNKKRLKCIVLLINQSPLCL